MGDDYAASGRKRREYRQAKDPDEKTPNNTPTGGRTKWCKKKIGKEHKPKCVDYDTVKRFIYFVGGMAKSRTGWKILVCTVCGKELERWHGQKPRPAWVVR